MGSPRAGRNDRATCRAVGGGYRVSRVSPEDFVLLRNGKASERLAARFALHTTTYHLIHPSRSRSVERGGREYSILFICGNLVLNMHILTGLVSHLY